MTEHVASRTLVKSPPELWAECSDAASLARHLDQFGDIKITRLDPEIAVAWEGDRARGTVRIEPAGWGTKVILTAEAVPEEKPEGPPAVVEFAEVETQVVVEPAEVEVAEVETAGEVEIVQVVEPEVDVPDAPHVPQADTSPPRRRWFPRLFRFRRVPRAAEPTVEPEEPVSEPEPAVSRAEPEPAPDPQRIPEPLLERKRIPEPTLEPEPLLEPEPTPEPTLEQTATDTGPETTEAALTAALDSLGQAHHRPYSRA